MQGKYRNIRAELDGVVYDSRKEMRRAAALTMMARAGIITNLERQKRFELQRGYVTKDGRSIRPIYYIADFFYFDREKNCLVVEDVKGVRTEVYKIKKKLFEYNYPNYLFLET